MRAAPRTLRPRRGRETHGSGTDHEDGVPGTDGRGRGAVEPDRVGLDERGVAGIDVVTDGERGGRRHRHELREPTGASPEAHEDCGGAVDDVAGEAPVARATRRDREDGRLRPLVPAPGARTHPHDLAAELVAHDGALREGTPRFEVRSAEPARGDPHQQLAGLGHRVGHRP